MTIIREIYLYKTKVIFMLKHSVKLRRYINYVMWQHVVVWRVCCVLCRVGLSQGVCTGMRDALRHAATSPNLYNDVIVPSVLT